jgi:protein-S-isoprenylcysteine O-methyltransferase Ste14
VRTLPRLADPILVCWGLLELGLRVREAARGKGRREHDRGTRVMIVVSIGLALGAAGAAHSRVTGLRMPEAARWIGLGVMCLGLATRVWAVAALGRSFRTTVEVDPGQAVVTSGPYRWVRHPAYTGLLLILAGYGLALGNWLSFAACLVIPLPAFLQRIRIEEAELDRVLGDTYRSYQATTARLIPRVW